jgi:GntP family gluconate:H+ symporter
LTGTIVGRILAGSGGLLKLAEGITWRVHQRWLKTATAAAGLLVGIGVSVEAAFMLLSPAVAATAKIAKTCSRSLRLALALALAAGHNLLLPAPGPVIATAVLAADPALVLLFGVIAAMTAGSATLLFVTLAGHLLQAAGDHDPDWPRTAPVGATAGLFRSALPIAVPLLFLGVATVGHFASEPLGGGGARRLLLAAGAPPTILVLAVSLAIWSAVGLRNQIVGEKGWIAEAITAAAPLILIGSAGIALGHVLQNSKLPDRAADALFQVAFSGSTLLLIAGSFAVAAVLKTAQGSSLVAVISAAGVVEPWFAASDSTTRSTAVIAIGAGAMVISHANDGMFWIVVRSLGLSPGRGYITQSLGSLVTGAGALIAVLALCTVVA